MSEITNKAISNASEATRRRNPHLFARIVHDKDCHLGDNFKDCPACQQDDLRSERKRVRQSSKPLLNKLEQECLDWLTRQYPNWPAPRAQAKTYRLGNGVKYTPDLTSSAWPYPSGSRETAWEVKGERAWDDAIVKLKMAATVWPEVRWLLVWKENGHWFEQDILP